MEFIVMLTRDDRTVADCLALAGRIAPLAGLGLKHVGFKDVGVPPATLEKLHARIKAMGAISYMEVVSTTPEACLTSARVAAELGVDCLLGGTQVDEVQAILAGKAIQYYPFPGFPRGHPTKLGGTAQDVARHCRAFLAKKCAGVDLLAYRATEADPLDLVRAAKDVLGEAWLIVAGSVNSPQRIDDLARARADAFTIGTAAIDGSFAPGQGGLEEQLKAVLAACAAAAKLR
ncbi:MAG: hypothetical protein ACT4N4_05790 [Rhodospirillales bacterium]